MIQDRLEETEKYMGTVREMMAGEVITQEKKITIAELISNQLASLMSLPTVKSQRRSKYPSQVMDGYFQEAADKQNVIMKKGN